MYIDCHTHGDPAATRDPQAYVAACRERGIEAIVLIEPLDRCLRAVERYGDFVIPVALVDMDAADGPGAHTRAVDRCLDAGCAGIKFIRPGAPYGDERYWPLYARIEERGAAAVFHTGYLIARGREQRPVQIEHMRAVQIDVIARRFPDLKILMAHFSNPWWEEAWKISWSHPNVYADLSGGTAIHRSTSMWAECFAPDGELLESSVRKLCFASDVRYLHEGEYPFEPYVAFYERILGRIGAPEALREQVYRGNARALFGLEGAGS
jgi:predicted TIM-barrel fold metal-dependent hydrolase